MKTITIIFGLMVLSFTGLSQVFKGTIKNSETGEPLKEVEVWTEETNNRVLSDESGNFSLSTPEHKPYTICFNRDDYMFEELRNTIPETDMKITLRKKKISAASKRWEKYMTADSCISYQNIDIPNNPEWYVSFIHSKLKGDLAPNSTKVRRDPSAIRKIGDLYYVWYSRSEATPSSWWRDTVDYERIFPWDMCDIWYATSNDGFIWKEHGPAVVRGEQGSYDDRSVFTPEIFVHKEKYYLLYQVVEGPYIKRMKNQIAMAIADSPDGPWTKLPEPILSPSNNGIWMKGSTDNHDAVKKGDFDSHKVHDPCLQYYKGKFYLYYKGERMGEEMYCGQREIKWGVAIANKPEGPYVKSEFNPLTTSGHECAIWQYKGGIALVHNQDGPEAETIQYAKDGLNFQIMERAVNVPDAPGIYRPENTDASPTTGIEWGMGHVYGWEEVDGGWNCLIRFDLVHNK